MGLGDAVMFFTYAAVFKYGSVLINNNELDFNGLMKYVYKSVNVFNCRGFVNC